MWESGACRSALAVLLFGNSERGALPLSQESKFSDFVDMFISRRDTTSTIPASSSTSVHETSSHQDAPVISITSAKKLTLPTTFDRRFTVLSFFRNHLIFS